MLGLLRGEEHDLCAYFLFDKLDSELLLPNLAVVVSFLCTCNSSDLDKLRNSLETIYSNDWLEDAKIPFLDEIMQANQEQKNSEKEESGNDCEERNDKVDIDSDKDKKLIPKDVSDESVFVDLLVKRKFTLLSKYNVDKSENEDITEKIASYGGVAPLLIYTILSRHDRDLEKIKIGVRSQLDNEKTFGQLIREEFLYDDNLCYLLLLLSGVAEQERNEIM